MIIEETYILSNGVEIPKLGLGTWFIDDGNASHVVREAAKVGYRHIDTAQAYKNESGVGDGVRGCGVIRQDMFVTTKLAAEIKTYKKAAAAIDGSLKRMGLDYIDMMIIHSPQPWTKFRGDDHFFEGNREAWRSLEDAYKAGKLHAIGVSNFEQPDIENILSSCTVKPMVNQVLAHVGNTPFGLIQYTQSKGILVEAYSPIAHGVVLGNQEIMAIAKKYDVSVPQLCIRYDLQLGLLPLPKTSDPEHMKSNIRVDFTISDEDMELLKNAPQIKDYGDAGIMPVFGGKLNLKSVVSHVFKQRRN
jgi:diketogulonate reductase-like aldo/keto reductase